MGSLKFLTFTIFLTIQTWESDAALSLASYYGDHMVLQKAPKSSYIWGYADIVGDEVTVRVGDQPQTVKTKVYKDNTIGKNIWKVMLPPQQVGDPVTITITSSEGTITMEDVLFGDVWVCSGQSNMQFTLSMVFNASQEVADAMNYPDIRLFTVALKFSNKTEYDLLQVEQEWTRPNRDAVGHSDWSYFSAVCWLFGKYLYKELNYPIGLVDTDWGGTPVEAWSSQDAMDACNPAEPELAETRDQGMSRPQEQKMSVAPRAGNQNTPTYLWNAMIHPILNLTIYGAIWYQGEANAGNPEPYKCRFPAMISDWRTKFNQASNGQTGIIFPFGFVQLAPWRNDPTITTGFPDIRWHQTYDHGYVPNENMPNTFMAVAIDLPDFTSPYNSIHPRDKQDVASRLVLSALPVAYYIPTKGRSQGPMISSMKMNGPANQLMFVFDNGTSPINVRTKDGFEICCSMNKMSKCDGSDSKWMAAPIAASDMHSVTVPACANGWNVGVRYAWRESPCTTVKMCAVYSVENDLPMPPYISIGLISSPVGNIY